MNKGYQEGIKILNEQIEAGEWYGRPPVRLNADFAVSLSFGDGCFALATFGGWLVMSARDLRDLIAMVDEYEGDKAE